MEKEYYIFGASGHGKVVNDAAKTAGIRIKSFIDDEPKNNQFENIPVVATADMRLTENSFLIIAVGKNIIRKKIVQQNNFSYFKAIHNQTAISDSVLIGEGTVVMPHAVINAGANIGRHCIINSASLVEHDCLLEDFVHISPNAALAGNVKIGKGSHIGIGACVIQGIKIGKWCTIGAGAVIINNIPDGSLVVGNPGKVIRTGLDVH